MKKILIVGGAGYIGSHMVKFLSDHQYDIVILDNLSSGLEKNVLAGRFILGDIADQECLENLFQQYNFDAVMHFASFIQVGESVLNPSKYYQNNLCATINLLDAMVKHDVKKFIFSSTAAIFGNPEYVPIDEKHVKHPINPYGRTKLMVENILDDYDIAYGLKSVCLRYFNAAGADANTEIGECHNPETHLIPLALQAASGRRDSLKVFGRDYKTPDGTCVRDYIHVLDLCSAHLLALEELTRGGISKKYNLGNGCGFSVQEVIDATNRVTGKTIKVYDDLPRAGDPGILIADASLISQELAWKPAFPDLETIICHAWLWEQKNFWFSFRKCG